MTLKATRKYWKVKKDTLDRNLRRRGYGLRDNDGVSWSRNN